MATDTAILVAGQGGSPLDYLVPDAQELIPLSARAVVDGSGAATAFLPVIQLISDAGLVLAEAITDTSVAAGGSAQVSWFPRVKAGGAVTTFALAVRCQARNAGGNASFGKADLGASFDDVWVHADVSFSAAFLNEEIANTDTQPFLTLWAVAVLVHEVDVSAATSATPYLTYNSHALTTLFTPITADTWYTLDFRNHVVGANTQFELWVNGVSVGAVAPRLGVATLIDNVRFGFATGNFSTASGFDATMWVRNCKVGTTKGASDLFDDGAYAAGTVEPPFSGAGGFPALVPEPFILGRGEDLWP